MASSSRSDPSLEATKEPTACARCGHDPACGYGSINGDRYCHDDDCGNNAMSGSTCYMRQSWEDAAVQSLQLETEAFRRD